MVVTEFATAIETETKNELLVLNLLWLLGKKEFFGGVQGGENILTREMQAYLKYCQTIGKAIVPCEGISYTVDMDLGIVHGLAVPKNFADKLAADPEGQSRLLVVAAVTQRNRIMAGNLLWTAERYNLPAECEDQFNLAAKRINSHYFGFGDFLNKQLDIQLV